MKPDISTTQSRTVLTEELMRVYNTLYTVYGHQNWWPSDGWFETIVGVILAQNVSWAGASKAVHALKDADLLYPDILAQVSRETVAPLIYPSRYYNQKAMRLQFFSRWFMDQYHGDIFLMEQEQTEILREKLLSISGFGPETVDSILLYACNKPVFVVDAYTRRVGSRIGWYPKTSSYHEMQDFFQHLLLPDPALYNDYHAQFVNLGSTVCKSDPICRICLIRNISGMPICRYADSHDDETPGSFRLI